MAIKFIKYVLISMFVTTTEIIALGLIFVKVIDPMILHLSIQTQDRIYGIYMIGYLILNSILAVFLSRRANDKLIYLHIPIALFSLIPFVLFVGAFYF